ncbi:MAG TPA: MBL fold metallo-hydrolase [Stellaceae bacterium]|jgi:ribonuclease Z|nr:MBL fold metallo-hydrolase [Stellaceae bacterium]
MFELVFLGTAGSVPSVERGLPALLVRFGRHRVLIDCGEGTQRQLRRSGAGYRRIDRILLTHEDLDHVLGLAGLTATLALQADDRALTIHGGKATLRFVQRYLVDTVWDGRPPLALTLEALMPGRVWEGDGFRIDCFRVRHRDTDSFGFRFCELGRRHLEPALATALGIPEGPAWHDLAHGVAVILADGRRIEPDAVLGPQLPGAAIVVIGDVEETDSLCDAARGVDALVVEASFLARDGRLARQRGHLTAAAAGRFAAECGVGALYLTHISERYGGAEVLDEARRHFARAHLAADLERVVVSRTGANSP